MSSGGDLKTVLAASDECFLIAPIGPDDSEIRRRSDSVLNYVVRPAMERLNLRVVRADEISRPGEITRQILQHVVEAKAAVADLTGSNPNVYYELAVRHTVNLPVVLIAEKEEKLPFDVLQQRTIFFDHRDLGDAKRAEQLIERQMREALGGKYQSPVTAAIDLAQMAKGPAQERELAELIGKVDGLQSTIHELSRRFAAAEKVSQRLDALRYALDARDKPQPRDPNQIRSRAVQILINGHGFSPADAAGLVDAVPDATSVEGVVETVLTRRSAGY